MRYLNCFMCCLAFAAAITFLWCFFEIFGGGGFAVLYVIAGGWATCALVERFEGEKK